MGLIQTPSAESKPEGSVSIIFNKNDIWKFTSLSVSPFDWMEAGYFYYRPSDLIWEGNQKQGHYLDKGFNIKFTYKPKNHNLPNFAVGLDDFAGTGYLTREYLVSTKQYKYTKLSLGIGWGKYVGNKSFTNPLSLISNSVKDRPNISENFKSGGSLSYDQWFRGDVSIFGGIEYILPKHNNISIKLEYDPFNYLDFSALNRSDADILLRKKDSNINFGLNYSINENLVFDFSYIKGNTFNFSFNFGITFNDMIFSKPKFKPIIEVQENLDKNEDIFYLNLLSNLNKNRLFLQKANFDDSGNLDLVIATSEHRNAIRSSSYAAKIANDIGTISNIDLTKISITHMNAGINLNKVSYIANYFDNDDITPIEVKIRNTKLDSGFNNEINSYEFQPKVNFPVIFSSFSPTIVSHIGNPEKFYFGGINIQNISEIQFNRNLLLSSEINLRVYDTFRDTVSGPASKMEHVRTDLIQYLKEDDAYITRMQLDYIWSPSKNIYAKVSGGIFESMFGGYGGEVLYKPFNKNFSIGAELFNVKQRTFDQRFKFQDYKTTTGHINFSYVMGMGIELNLSAGRYLAKDDGYTFDIGRITKSGFKSGIYFTRTNVSADLFGEGSFDKGFYFQIPMDLLSKNYRGNYSSIKVSPLTRDGGAKLIHDKDLKGLIYNSSYYQLHGQWDGYLD